MASSDVAPEVLRGVLECVCLPSLAAAAAASTGWRDSCMKFDNVWRRSYQRLFLWYPLDDGSDALEGAVRNARELQRSLDEGAVVDLAPGWYGLCRFRWELERMVDKAWRTKVGDLQTGFFPMHFSSYVRSFAVVDGLMLVAGLFNGEIVRVDLQSDDVHRYAGRHGDEVIAIDVCMNWIISGSGDPGYYHRRGHDNVARIWKVSGGLHKRLEGHRDSVRAVLLLPLACAVQESRSEGRSSAGCDLALTGSEDGTLRLWEIQEGTQVALFDFGEAVVAIVHAPRDSIASSGIVLVATASHIFWLSAGILPLSPRLLFTGHRLCSLDACLAPAKGHLPLLQLAAGTMDSKVLTWTSYAPYESFQHGAPISDPRMDDAIGLRHETMLVETPRGGPSSVVSVRFCGPRWLLGLTRAGFLSVLQRTNDGNLVECSRVVGLRMYASTLRVLGPCRFASDGFDNVIRTLAVQVSVDNHGREGDRRPIAMVWPEDSDESDGSDESD